MTAVIVLSGCVMNTTVAINSNVDNAKVTLDGQPIGQTPTITQVSNAAWNDPLVKIEAEGYRPYVGSIDKELRIVIGVFELLLWWPSLRSVWGT